jgi:hypothetical protein
VLEVVSPSGERLAYNDDYFPALISGESLSELALQPTDSAITSLTLTEAGDYQLRVNSFNGVSVGDVELIVKRVDAAAVQVESVQTGVFAASVTLRPDQVARIEIPLETGNPYTITVRDPLGVLDPVTQISDAAGTVLAVNDDHRSSDFTLNIFDSRIADFTPAASGDYLLAVRDYLGRGGVLEVDIRVVE